MTDSRRAQKTQITLLPALLLALLVVAVQEIHGQENPPAVEETEGYGVVSLLHIAPFQTTEGQRLYSIEVDYDTGGDSIFMDDVGPLEGKGTFSFLADSPEVRWRRAPNDRNGILVSYRGNSEQTPERAIEIRDCHEFSEAGIFVPWTNDISQLPIILFRTLKDRGLESRPWLDPWEKYFCVTTTYKDISQSLDGKGFARLALRFIYPRSLKDVSGFEVSRQVQEKRVKSREYRAAKSRAVLEAAEEFVNDILKDIDG